MIAEDAISLPCVDGPVLAARLALPAGAVAGVAICHPHPLHGGDMDSPVVASIVAACRAAHVATLRFNFRGVGASTGAHDGGRGEQHDAVAALDHLAGLLGPDAVAAAGYSFGATVAASVAARRALCGLALIAPPWGRTGMAVPSVAGRPATLVVAGVHDEYCPPQAVTAIRTALPDADVHVIAGADHFFGGALRPLGSAVEAWARTLGTRDPLGRGCTR
jgi:uncharacterized protein